MEYPYSENDPVSSALRRMASYQPDKRDEDLRRRWQQQEAATLQQIEGGNEYGLGEVLRDVVPGALGAVLDLTTNDGRGLANIGDASLQRATANLARDAQRRDANRDFALKQRQLRQQNQGAEFDRAYKTAGAMSERDRIEIARGNLANRGESLAQGAVRTGIAADKAQYDRGVDDPRRAAIVDSLVASGVDRQSLEGIPIAGLAAIKTATDQQLRHAAAPQVAQDEALKAGASSAATTGARIGTEARLADTSADTAATIASAREGASTAARIGAESDLADVSAATKQRAARGTAAGRMQGEGDMSAERFISPLARDVVNPERVAMVQRNPQMAKLATEKLAASSELLATIDDLVSVREREAQGLIKPGEARSQFDAARGRLEGLMSQSIGMGVLQEQDRRAIGQYLGASQASWLDLSGLLGGDVKLDQLQGVRSAFGAADRRTAQEFGFGEYGTAPIGTAAPAPAAPAQRPQLPTPRAPAPPIGQAVQPASSGGMVTVRLGGEARQVDSATAERLKVMDPNVEILR